MFGAVLWPVYAGAAGNEEPDAAALVRQVRARESWVERVRVLRIKADETGFDRRRGSRNGKPSSRHNSRGPTVSGFRDLKPEKDGRVDLAFDRSRVRFRATTVGEDDDLRIWDGSRFILANHYDYAPDRDGYLINRDPERWLYWLPLDALCVVSRRARTRSGGRRRSRCGWDPVAGKPEDFVYGGAGRLPWDTVPRRESPGVVDLACLSVWRTGGCVGFVRAHSTNARSTVLHADDGQRERDAPAHRCLFRILARPTKKKWHRDAGCRWCKQRYHLRCPATTASRFPT